MDYPELLVSYLGAAEEREWDDFVSSHPDGTFFHLSGWRKVLEKIFHHRTYFLLARRQGRIVGVLPLAEIKSLIFGHSMISLPFCVYGGAIGDQKAIELLDNEAVRIGQSLGIRHLELRHIQPRHTDWPRQEIYVTFRKFICDDDDQNMLAIPRKQRAMVRKGIKSGLSSTEDTDVARFFTLYSDNVLRHGTPALPKRFFQELMEVFGDRCRVMTVTDSTGRALSTVLSFYFRNEVLPYYAGDDFAGREVAANDFKYWELMRRSAGEGLTLFDYGRSKVGTGSYHFKKNWGFTPHPLSYEHHLFRGDAIPQNNPLNPKYRAFIALWKRLPLSVANTIGPYIVRSLG